MWGLVFCYGTLYRKINICYYLYIENPFAGPYLFSNLLTVIAVIIYE